MSNILNEEIDVLAILTVRKGTEEKFKDEVKKFMHTIINHNGILYHSFHQSQENKCDFIFYERYISKVHLDEHTNSKELKLWKNIRDTYVIQRKLITLTPLMRIIMDNKKILYHDDMDIIIS